MKLRSVVCGLLMMVGSALIGSALIGPAFAKELPDNSIYLLDSTWKTQSAREMKISALAGHTQIMAFVYTYCEHTCPMIVAKLRLLDSSIPDDLKPQTRITLVSLDPDRDTPQVLRAYMKKHALDESRWTMLSGDKDTVQELAAAMGARYRPMGQDDIAHSNTLSILDPSGVMVHQSKGVSEPVSELLDSIRKAVQTSE